MVSRIGVAACASQEGDCLCLKGADALEGAREESRSWSEPRFPGLESMGGYSDFASSGQFAYLRIIPSISVYGYWYSTGTTPVFPQAIFFENRSRRVRRNHQCQLLIGAWYLKTKCFRSAVHKRLQLPLAVTVPSRVE